MKTNKSQEGYEAGYADRLLGYSYTTVEETPEMADPEFTLGYSRGWDSAGLPSASPMMIGATSNQRKRD